MLACKLMCTIMLHDNIFPLQRNYPKYSGPSSKFSSFFHSFKLSTLKFGKFPALLEIMVGVMTTQVWPLVSRQ